MAYNPSLYNPYGQQQPYSWYQPLPTMTDTQTAAQPVNGLVSVTGIEGAKAYQLPPNSSMPLFDQNNDILYLKTTDSAGYPTIRTFSFKAVEQADQKPQPVDYVPRSEFDQLSEKVEKLISNRRTRKAPDGE